MFKFFRDLTTGFEPNVADEKGYDVSTAKALADSLPDRIDYKGKVKDTMTKIERYSADLSKLVAENPALQDGWIMKDSAVVHGNNSKVLGTHSKSGNNEIFSIKNFYDDPYNGERAYGIIFPYGKWQEVLNSDKIEYAGSGSYTNTSTTISSDGKSASKINLGGSGVSVWKKTG